MFKIPSYSTSTKIPLNKNVIESSDVNDQITTVETQLQSFDNQVILTKQTTTVNLTANQDVYVPVDASGGPVTVNLPSGSAHSLQPIIIKKIDATLNAITITVDGATTDKIERPYRSETTPTFTTLPLVLPGEQVALYPLLDSGVYYWRAINYQGICEQVFADVYLNTNQSVASGGSYKIIEYDTKTSDPFSAFDSVTNHRFTVPVTGYYDFQATAQVNPTGATDIYIQLYKNASVITRGLSSYVAATAAVSIGGRRDRILCTSTTDYLDARLTSEDNSSTISSGDIRTSAQFILKQRY